MSTAPSSEPGADVNAPTELTHRQILLVFSGLMAGMAVAALDQTVVSTALPTIVGDLGGLDRISWVVTSYLLASTAVMPLVGKLSDAYGRKLLFQLAISVFTLGSLLCGLAVTMNQLIAFRAVQGAGAGALMVLVFAIVGDIVSPRERGRYQGLIAAVFAVSSVIGPFIGGFIVDHFDWSWVFLVNIPVGIAALAITQRVLHIPFTPTPQRIDWLGAVLLMFGVVCLMLVTVWGGTQYAWGDQPIVGLAAVGVGLIAAFIWHARHIDEPVIPTRLFSNRVFSTVIGQSVVLGLAMFGAIVFLPLFLQVVQGRTATNSGLLMLPVMAGILVASIVSGRLVTRWGRYKIFPILGGALITLGYVGFVAMDATTSIGLVWVAMVLTGLGIGMTTPVLVLAVQNDVDWRDLGSATSSVTFFRQLGASFGTAVFGAVFAARFTALLSDALGTAFDGAALIGSPGQIRALDPELQATVIDAMDRALNTTFALAIPFAVIAFGLAWVLPERPLRETAAQTFEPRRESGVGT